MGAWQPCAAGAQSELLERAQALPGCRGRPIHSGGRRALESGEAQLANKSIALSDIDRFEKLKHVVVDVTPWPYVGDHQQIYFNFDSEPFRKREVRQAVAQSLNVEVFARTVWYGRG